jgi:hypothetical protein
MITDFALPAPAVIMDPRNKCGDDTADGCLKIGKKLCGS